VCVCVFCIVSFYALTEMCVCKGGAGNYVKMVHNGIEYGDMQVGWVVRVCMYVYVCTCSLFFLCLIFTSNNSH